MNLWVLVTIFLCYGGTSGQEFFSSKNHFVDVTQIYFGEDNFGTIAAFGDYDGDGSPDAFIITDDEHEVVVKSKSLNGNQWQEPSGARSVLWPNNTIVSVTPSDFTGDEITDLLVTVLNNNDDLSSIEVYLHTGNSDLQFGEPIPVSRQHSFLNQPLVADYNFDMVADVFGATDDGSLHFFVFNGKDFDQRLVRKAENGQTPVHYAFVDLDGDMNADLFVASDNASGRVYEAFRASEEDADGLVTWQPIDSYSHILEHNFFIGVSSFVDIDADGYLDQVVPVCDDESCTKSSIKIFDTKPDMWKEVKLTLDLGEWHFPAPGDIPAWRRITAGLQLRAGDFNLDSYSDFTCIMRNGENKTNEVVILINDGGKSVTVEHVPATESKRSPLVSAFADISMTAHLDIVVITESEEGNMYHLMSNTFTPDANFIKVEVVRRTCPRCTGSHVSNLPGPVTKYQTTTPSGEKQKLVATLLSQSSYLALQLPYVIMGLGSNPNFVDLVEVNIPNKCCDVQVQRSKSWLSLIPNSQLIVYPKNLNDPNSWQSSLIIHPSQSVLLTGVVLIGTCCFIGLIAGLLHLLERRQDDKQKRQEAHKFHFDAM